VLLREGLARLVEDSGAVVVAAVGDGPSLVDAVVTHHPDVSVVDVRMPPTQRDEGLRAAIEARRRVPGSPVLVLSQYVERQYASELLADGAGGVGYLLKDRVADVRDFMDALRRVAAGGTALDPEVVAQLMVRRRRDDRLAALTPREREVLAAMAEGRTNVGIATVLGISEGAAEKHISNIFGKLDLQESQTDHRRVLAVLAIAAAVHLLAVWSIPRLIMRQVLNATPGVQRRRGRVLGADLGRLGRRGNRRSGVGAPIPPSSIRCAVLSTVPTTE